MFKRVYQSYRNWKQRDFLKWRDDLSEYERDFFLPELKGRCTELLKYVEYIDSYCIKHQNDKIFGCLLRNLIMEESIEHLIPPENQPDPPNIIAEKYFNQTDERIAVLERKISDKDQELQQMKSYLCEIKIL